MELSGKLKEKLLDRLDITRNLSDEELYDIITSMVMEEYQDRQISLKGKLKISRELFHSIRGLDVMQEILDDESVTEIMVNGYDHIFIEKQGKLFRYPGVFSSREKLSDIIQIIVGKANKRVNEASPIVDTRLPDGSRVNVVLDPVAVNGPVITIRKFPKTAMSMEDLLSLGSITKEAGTFLKKLVKNGYNIFISGGTSSCKTTFLNALSASIDPRERVIIIEDSAELQITHIDNKVHLECRAPNSVGKGAVTMESLIRT
jgi:pilus assembly protein CpaF